MEICYFYLMESIYVTWFSDKSQADQLLLKSLLQWHSFYGWQYTGVWTPMPSPQPSLCTNHTTLDNIPLPSGHNWQYVPSKRLYPPTRPHHVTVQKTTIWFSGPWTSPIYKHAFLPSEPRWRNAIYTIITFLIMMQVFWEWRRVER